MAFWRRLAGGLMGLALIGAATAAFPEDAAAPGPTPTAAPAPAPALDRAAIPIPAPVPVPAGVPAAQALPGEAAPPPTPAATPSSSPARPSPAARPKKRRAPPPPLETALSSDPTPTLTPDTAAFDRQGRHRYAAIAAAGGWPTTAAAQPALQGPAVADLRRRLAIEGGLDRAAAEGLSSLAWDANLTAAVKRFQARMGLRQTGIVAGATLKALDVPGERARAKSRRQRAPPRRSLPSRSGSATSSSICRRPRSRRSKGTVAIATSAIVGDVDHPSPQIAAHVAAINLNPTWTVPVSIIKKEIIPRMQRDPGYLAREKIRILDGEGGRNRSRGAIRLVRPSAPPTTRSCG